ncbi:MAG TPA: O-antigen ligase family protein [Clostridia bacterium]|nr:O-antigen ligase family protein [Clostridia bacterium]
MPFLPEISLMSSFVYGALCLALGLTDPIWAVYGLFVTVTNYGFMSISEEATAVRIIAPVALISLVLYLVRHARPVRVQRSTPPLVFFIAYSVAITAIYGRLTNQLLGVAALALLLNIFVGESEINRERTIKAFILAVLVSALAGLIKGGFINAGNIERFIGGYTDPNEFAKYMLLGIVFTTSVNWHSRLVKHIITLSLWGALLLTYSRMGLVIGIAVLLIQVVSGGTQKSKSSLLVFGGATVIIFILVIVSVTSLGQALQIFASSWSQRFQTQERPAEFAIGSPHLYRLNDLTANRLDLYLASVQEWSRESIEVQLAGGGYNYSRIVLARRAGQLISTHSTFLQVLLDFGVFGLLLFVILCVSKLDTTSWRLPRFLHYNLAWLVYIASFLALAWVFSWSNLMFFAVVGARSRTRRKTDDSQYGSIREPERKS